MSKSKASQPSCTNKNIDSKAISKFSSVDEYGFERKEDFDSNSYEEFISDYMSVLTRRSKKWEDYLKNKESINFDRKAKRYIRKGIPLKYRGKVWMMVSGAESKKKASPGYYNELLNQPKNPELVESVKIDLPRTFPDNIYFKATGSGRQNSLSNVLLAFGTHNTSIGYCQGLNYIAGVMLLVVDNEESVFWLLTVLIESILPGYHTQDMTGVLADIYSLSKLIQEKKPVLWKHLEYNNVDLSLVVTKWFVCVFVDVLPIETVLRVWDCIFYEGNKIIIRVAVSLIFSNEEKLFMSQDFGSIIECFKSMVQNKECLHCHSFIQTVFKVSGPLPRTSINQLRKEGEEKALTEKEEFLK